MRSKYYEKFMEIAIEEARISLKEGNKGFGAVLVKDEKAIAQAHDTEVTDSDLTAHAEINVIRKASKNYGEDLAGCILFSTHEPCPMCTGALIWAKVSEVVYGASIRDTVKLGRTMIHLSCREIMKMSPWKIKLKSGVLKGECLKFYNEETRKLVKKFSAANREWNGIERELTEKRVKWFEDNKASIFKRLKGSDVEKAYHLILTKIGIKEDDTPIVEKTENSIVFHSKNFCPALEACRIMGLDTREVCKAIFEKPTQELIKRINPKLKFRRNYKRIRPYTPYCEEIILLGKQ